MYASPRDAYLETEVTTATPQRLRLMLIEAAIRRARAAQAAWNAGNVEEGNAAAVHCREIISELIAGIQPDQSDLAKQVLGIYLFLFSTIMEAQIAKDAPRLDEIIRVLEEERVTWQTVCEQMPERPAVIMPIPTEEAAPQRVAGNWGNSYGELPNASVSGSAFSIDA